MDKKTDPFENPFAESTDKTTKGIFDNADRAVALQYDGQQAPVLTAKGVEDVAKEMIAIARAYDIPLYHHPELAALLSNLDIDEAVPQALYVTVAKVIAFAWQLSGKK